LMAIHRSLSLVQDRLNVNYLRGAGFGIRIAPCSW
jgi:hypothetical protein